VPLSALDVAERLTVNVYLRRRPDGPPLPDPFEIGAQSPRQRQHLTSEEFEERYGAAQSDVDAVIQFARGHGLTIVAVSLARRTVTVEGSAAGFAEAFAVVLTQYWHPTGVYHTNRGAVQLPAELAGIIVGVTGLDNRVVAAPMLAVHPGIWDPSILALAQFQAAVAAHHEAEPRLAQLHQHLLTQTHGDAWQQNDANREYAEIVDRSLNAAAKALLDALNIKTPPGVAQLYNFPSGADGSGQTIAIIELGGGYYPASVEAYFSFLGVPMPKIREVSVLGGHNSPGKNQAYDIEVAIDIDVAGGVAPGADLVCYFAPVSAAGFIEAIHTAIHDRENRPSTISISWALSEGYWLAMPGVLDIFDSVLAEAALLGITICCASGDYGAFSELHDGRLWVDYPSSNPHVLACGGTTLYSRGETVIAEIVWNTLLQLQQATGGGISGRFPLPPWQEKANVPPSANWGGGSGRGVPDVAAVGDPLTGYLVQVHGIPMAMAGTSSVAPLYAALFARINQILGTRVGYLNPWIYQRGTGAFRDILFGNNPVYSAGPGWNACTGWGAPDGMKLLELLRAD
jgi:kumamolisin